MDIQEFLKKASLSELRTKHGVKSRIVGSKVGLNYDQIEADEGDPIASQCRGLILAASNTICEDSPLGDTVVLARPFDRFFNLGQAHAANVQLEESRVFEKLDGTLTILYYDLHKEEWHIGTRSVPEADIPLSGDDSLTFRYLFERALKDTVGCSFQDWTHSLPKNYTYMFELCTPLNQVVVEHSDFSVTLIGCRQTQNGAEFWPKDVGQEIGVPYVLSHSLSDYADIMKFVQERDPRKFEGVVVCDHNFRRVKIKNAQYLAYSRLSDVVSSPRNVMELIVTGLVDDAIPVMSTSMKSKAEIMAAGYGKIVRKHPSLYEMTLAMADASGAAHGSKEHRKAFVDAARTTGVWFEVAMTQYSGKCHDVESFVNQKMSAGKLPAAFLDTLIQKSMEDR